MLRAVLAHLRMWLDLLISIVGPRGRRTGACSASRGADPQGRAEVPLLRHLARMGRAVGFGSHSAPLSRITPSREEASQRRKPPWPPISTKPSSTEAWPEYLRVRVVQPGSPPWGRAVDWPASVTAGPLTGPGLAPC